MKLISVFTYKNEPKARLKVKDNYSHISTVYIEPCYESYEQYGANTETLWFTLPIAEKLTKTRYFQSFKKGKGLHRSAKETILNQIQ